MGAFAEARSLAWERLDQTQEFSIKGRSLDAAHILGSASRARDFADGPVILARLSPMDYHHVHYSDDGRTVGHDRMGGRLWTVNWHALLNKPDILFENERHISILVAEFRADWLRRNRRIVGRTHRAGTFRRQAISTR